MKKLLTARIYFQDEFRNIKAGWREAEVKQKGGFVYVRPVAPKGSHWSKMRADLFYPIFGDYLPKTA